MRQLIVPNNRLSRPRSFWIVLWRTTVNIHYVGATATGATVRRTPLQSRDRFVGANIHSIRGIQRNINTMLGDRFAVGVILSTNHTRERDLQAGQHGLEQGRQTSQPGSQRRRVLIHDRHIRVYVYRHVHSVAKRALRCNIACGPHETRNAVKRQRTGRQRRRAARVNDYRANNAKWTGAHVSRLRKHPEAASGVHRDAAVGKRTD